MPYTFAHLGYIIPLRKKFQSYFSVLGLVFGSIVPDYDILFRFTENRFHLFQYDLHSVFVIILPLALVSTLYFDIFCKKIFIEYLPDFYYQKYKNHQQPFIHNLTILNVIKTSISIIIAIYIHLVLDFFCHLLDGFTVKILILTITQNIFLSELGYIVAIYLLPIVFTIFGFYLIYKSYLKGQKVKTLFQYSDKTKIRFWYLLILLTLLLSFVKLYFIKTSSFFLIDYLLISITSSFIISCYFLCTTYNILFYLKYKNKNA